MAEKLRACVVGAGWPSWQHMRGYKLIGEIELAALCDADPIRLERIADEYGVPRRYTSYEEMLDRESPDIVSVCTPNALHAEMSIQAMQKGAHVLCEKPMCVSSEAGREMIRVSKETGRVLMVGYQRRFSTEARYLKNAIDAGRLGTIYFVRAYWTRRRGIPGLGGWFTNKQLSGGGALIDIGVHVLDLGLWFLGYQMPLHVSASYGSHFGVKGKGGGTSRWRANNPTGLFDVDDYAVAHLIFGGGRSMMLQASWASHTGGDEVGIEIWGSEGGARLYPLQFFAEDGDALVDTTPRLPDIYPFELSTAHLVDVIRGRTSLICPPEEALRTIEIIERIYGADDAR